jgi:hypothetical protein
VSLVDAAQPRNPLPAAAVHRARALLRPHQPSTAVAPTISDDRETREEIEREREMKDAG